MTEKTSSTAEKPRDVYGAIVWVGRATRPVGEAISCAVRLAGVLLHIRGTQKERRAAQALMFAAVMATLGCIAVSLVMLTTTNLIWADSDFMAATLSTSLGLHGFGLVGLLADPVLWLGLVCGIAVRRSIQTPGNTNDVWLGESQTPRQWAIHMLGYLLLAAILCHFPTFFVDTIVRSLLNSLEYGVSDPVTALLNFLLIRSAVSPVSWDPILFPAIPWMIVHSATGHLVGIAELWTVSSLVAYVSLRLQSFAIGALACSMGLTLWNCYCFTFWTSRLQLPFSSSIREGMGIFLESLTGIPAFHGASLLIRLECMLLVIAILSILAWHLRRFRECEG